MSGSRRALLGLVLQLPMLAQVSLGQAEREAHGAQDVWAEPGLALAWGVLRGRDEGSTRVLIRIEVEPERWDRCTALGRDPFGGSSVALAVVRESSGVWHIDLPRSHFADHPRTELRFQAPGQSRPQLLVYFLGVPDTTPEAATDAQLQDGLQQRLMRARKR